MEAVEAMEAVEVTEAMEATETLLSKFKRCAQPPAGLVYKSFAAGVETYWEFWYQYSL